LSGVVISHDALLHTDPVTTSLVRDDSAGKVLDALHCSGSSCYLVAATSRLRSASIYPRPVTRTTVRAVTSSIQYYLLNLKIIFLPPL